MARPRKWTPELGAVIVNGCRIGLFRYLAAEIAGVSERTVKRWIDRGRRQWTEAEARLAEDPEAEFVLDEFGEWYGDVIAAEAQAEQARVNTILAASLTDPKWAEWWLRRKKNKRYNAAAPDDNVPVIGDPLAELESRVAAAIASAGADKGPPDAFH